MRYRLNEQALEAAGRSRSTSARTVVLAEMVLRLAPVLARAVIGDIFNIRRMMAAVHHALLFSEGDEMAKAGGFATCITTIPVANKPPVLIMGPACVQMVLTTTKTTTAAGDNARGRNKLQWLEAAAKYEPVSVEDIAVMVSGRRISQSYTGGVASRAARLDDPTLERSLLASAEQLEAGLKPGKALRRPARVEDPVTAPACGTRYDMSEERVQQARDGLGHEAKTSWDQWQTGAPAGSARKMRRLTRLKAKWQPTVIETSPGICPPDPGKLPVARPTGERIEGPRELWNCVFRRECPRKVVEQATSWHNWESWLWGEEDDALVAPMPRSDEVCGSDSRWGKLVRSKHKDADHRTAAWRDRKKPGHKYLKTKAQLRNKYAGQAEGESIKSTVYFDPKSALGARRKAEPLRSPSAVNGTRQRWFIMPTVAEQVKRERWIWFSDMRAHLPIWAPISGDSLYWTCPTLRQVKKELLDSVSRVGAELGRDDVAFSNIKLRTVNTKKMFLISQEPPPSDHEAPDEWFVNNRTRRTLELVHDVEFTRRRDTGCQGGQEDQQEPHRAMEKYEKQNYPTALEATNAHEKKAAQESYDQAVQAAFTSGAKAGRAASSGQLASESSGESAKDWQRLGGDRNSGRARREVGAHLLSSIPFFRAPMVIEARLAMLEAKIRSGFVVSLTFVPQESDMVKCKQRLTFGFAHTAPLMIMVFSLLMGLLIAATMMMSRMGATVRAMMVVLIQTAARILTGVNLVSALWLGGQAAPLRLTVPALPSVPVFPSWEVGACSQTDIHLTQDAEAQTALSLRDFVEADGMAMDGSATHRYEEDFFPADAVVQLCFKSLVVRLFLVVIFWSFVAIFWSLLVFFWSKAVIFWSLVVVFWNLVVFFWSTVVSIWSLVGFSWRLVAIFLLLVVNFWNLVVIFWSLLVVIFWSLIVTFRSLVVILSRLVMSYCRLVVIFWRLVVVFWGLVMFFWSLVAFLWDLAVIFWSMVVIFWSLAAFFWNLAVVFWRLAAMSLAAPIGRFLSARTISQNIAAKNTAFRQLVELRSQLADVGRQIAPESPAAWFTLRDQLRAALDMPKTLLPPSRQSEFSCSSIAAGIQRFYKVEVMFVDLR
ncbi:unnamed protein product [Prorocentrum cordatum]|uniref:Uncharacterized protein n=1 Tax=Prorocentrum cordatum TaxID=2364126 RepID=A0ABN9XQ72_9DINO|nr:unnamed protein product [Polarella glacialis]